MARIGSTPSGATATTPSSRVRRGSGRLGGAGDREHVTVTSDVVVSNIVLARSSTVSGLVSGPNGPAGDVQVELLLWDEDDEEFYGEDSAYTEEDGTYRLTINRPGHYTLFFDTDDSAAPVASAWLSGANKPPARPRRASSRSPPPRPTWCATRR